MSSPGTDLSSSYMARSNANALHQADTDLDSIIAGGQKQPQAQRPPNPHPPEAPDLINRALQKERAVGSDVIGGAKESGGQIVGGVLDAIGNTATGLNHLQEWMLTHLGLDQSQAEQLTGYTAGGLLAHLTGAIPQAKTYTGTGVREAAKFLTGFMPAMRAARLAGLATVPGSIAAGGVAGAAVNDPSAPNLTATIAQHVQVPASLQPAVNLLATNPDDPEAVNRARNMVENLGFGTLAEGVLRGVKAAGAARRSLAGIPPKAPTDPLEAMKAQYGETKPEDFAALGDPAKPAVSVSKKMADAMAATDGRVSIPTDAGGQVYINFARINEPDDVKNALDKMAGAFKSNIDEARRGVQTHDATKSLADDLGMSVDDLLARRKGQPFNAEQSLAARNLWNASGQKLVELAEKAASPNAGDVDRYAFRKMMATHYAIQNEVIAARTETARALNAWAIPSQHGVEQSRAIQAVLEEHGGSPVTTELARRISRLKAAGVGPDGIAAAVRKGWGATTMDAVRESYVNGLLWNPSTHIVNTLSSGVVFAQQIMERKAAEIIGDGGVAPGEAAAMLSGLTGGVGDAFRMASKAFRTGQSGASIGKAEVPRIQAISSDAVSQARGLDPAATAAFRESGLGKAVDFIGHATNAPGRALAAEDEFFKSIGFRAEVRAQAVRQATAEVANAPVVETLDAPDFRRWFIGSKAADSNGEPATLYHGTNRTFDDFSAAKAGSATKAKDAKLGIFFTDNPDVASSYAAPRERDYGYGVLSKVNKATNGGYERWNEWLLKKLSSPDAPNVRPVYLSVKNPLVVIAHDAHDYSEEFYTRMIQKAKAEGYDGVHFRNQLDYGHGQIENPPTPHDVWVAFDAAQVRSQLAGQSKDDLFANRYADLVNNPPEHIRIAAADAALYNTFQSVPSKMVRSLMQLRENSGPLGWLVLPFLKTPTNILAYTFERTPAAPLVARWRADVAAGGARKELALARIATGSAVMMTTFDLADSGLITGAGPSKPADLETLKRTSPHWQPYSIRLGDKYISYVRGDPLAMPFAFAATLSEKFKQAESSADDLSEWEQAIGAGVATVSQTVVDKTWFKGVSDIITAISESKTGPSRFDNWLDKQAGSLVPFSSLLNVGKKATDPIQRQTFGALDEIMAKMPILSQQLPARRDLWGKPMQPDAIFGRAYDVLSPFYASGRKEPSPIDDEMARLDQAGVSGSVSRIPVKTSFQGVPVNFRDYPNVYDRYVQLAGNELKHPAWGMGAKEFLDQMVTGKGPLSPIYRMYSDDGKAKRIASTIDEYRQKAQIDIIRNPKTDEERRFVDMVLKKQDLKRRAMLPQ